MKYLWVIQFSLLFIIACWTAIDPQFAAMTPLTLSSSTASSGNADLLRTSGLAALIGAAGGTLVFMLSAVIGRSHYAPQYRSIRSLLAITTLVAIWCAFAVQRDLVAWQGKRLRFQARVNDLERIVSPLRQNWPSSDGELPAVGPFMAYPFGTPCALILLQSPMISSDSIYVSAIERSIKGAIKLQLSGLDGGVWAEWHPQGSRPESFVGGIADQHWLSRSSEIGDGWYLVRYRS